GRHARARPDRLDPLEPGDAEERREDAGSREMLLGDGAGMPTRALPVRLDLADGARRVVEGAEGVQAGAARQHVAEAGVLLAEGAAAGEGARCPAADPAAPQADVQILRDRELAPGRLEVLAVAPRVCRDGERIDDRPPASFEQLPIARRPVDVHGELE